MSSNECPVCKLNLEGRRGVVEKTGQPFYDCPRCGVYCITESALADLDSQLENDTKVAVLSHAIRKMQRDEKPPLLHSYTIEIILKQKLPTPSEQANNFILWLGEEVSGVGETQNVVPQFDMSIIGAKTWRGFALISRHLQDSGYINSKVRTLAGKEICTLSFKGWEYYERLQRGVVNSTKAFMAMKFNDTALDKMFENYFKPAVLATGFDLVTLQDNPRAGLIDDRLRVEIRSSRFLIADLTHENAGAYWEAGFAEGLGKPVIYTCEKKKFKEDKTHFDTNHHLTVVWDSANPTQAIEDLKNTIRATLPAEAKFSE